MSFELDADTLVEEKEKKRVRFVSSQSAHLNINKALIQPGVMSRVQVAKAYLRVNIHLYCSIYINQKVYIFTPKQLFYSVMHYC